MVFIESNAGTYGRSFRHGTSLPRTYKIGSLDMEIRDRTVLATCGVGHVNSAFRLAGTRLRLYLLE